MYTSWNNILKFPKFFISVILGLFLIIFKPFFELLQKPQYSFIVIITISILFLFLLKILKLMLVLN